MRQRAIERLGASKVAPLLPHVRTTPVSWSCVWWLDRLPGQECFFDDGLRRATRYDQTPQSYLAGLHLRGAVIW